MKEKTAKTPAWRRWLRVGILLSLMMTAGALAWVNHGQDETVQPAPSAAPIVQMQQEERSRRESAYDKDIAALQKLLENAGTDAQTRMQAAQRMEQLIEEHQSETAIEEALSQAGFSPVLVLCQNGAITVMVKEELSAEASASVLSLCMTCADVAAENIRIMTVQP